MRQLALHLLGPVLTHPEALDLREIDTEDATILEAVVHPADRDALEAEGGRTLRAVRTILSAAAGRKKATFDLVEQHGEPSADADASA